MRDPEEYFDEEEIGQFPNDAFSLEQRQHGAGTQLAVPVTNDNA